MFLTADGESGKAGGNETIRVDDAGRLRIKVPATLVDSSVPFGDRRAGAVQPPRRRVVGARVAARQAVRYDISYDPGRDRWYLDASWKRRRRPVPSSASCVRAGAVGGSQRRPSGRLCARLLGQPIGEPITIAVDTAGLRASRPRWADARGISALLAAAHQQTAGDRGGEPRLRRARATGRETLGRGWRGKRFRRTVAGIPTATVPRPADRYGQPVRDRDHRGRSGLHQPLGRSALAQTLAAADFRPGHPAPCRGGCDRQTWPRAWRSGGGRQDPAPGSGRVRALHRPDLTSAQHHTTTVP